MFISALVVYIIIFVEYILFFRFSPQPVSSYIQFMPYIIAHVVFILFCFKSCNHKLENILYFSGIGILAIKELWSIINSIYTYIRFSFSEYISPSEYLPPIIAAIPTLIIFYTYFAVAKFKKGKVMAFVIGPLSLLCRAYLSFIFEIFPRTRYATYCFVIFETIAFGMIWWNQSRLYFIKSVPGAPELEKDLAALKKSFEAGEITEEEYASRKAELISKI